jgi:CheY-like chemotaxis protein
MERKRIIIADDESIIRLDLREMLTNLGYLVVGEASDGQSAVNMARELKPDLVIMDIRMPNLDGIEAAQILTEERILAERPGRASQRGRRRGLSGQTLQRSRSEPGY